MKIFVIGGNKTGKTTFASTLARELRLQHIQGSEWVKKTMSGLDTNHPNYREIITKKAIELLQIMPLACVQHIRDTYDLNKDSVIEGLRNPNDFHNLFDWRSDYVVFLSLPKSFTRLDDKFTSAGIKAIEAGTEFMIQSGLLTKDRITRFKFRVSCWYPPYPGDPQFDEKMKKISEEIYGSATDRAHRFARKIK